MTDDIEFCRLDPSHVAVPFDLDAPTRVAGDLEWEDLVSLLTLAYYFLHQNLDYDDVAARYGVTPESVGEMVEAELPAVCWWRSLLSRAREAQGGDEETEVEDWQIIGGVVMGFYALHLSFDDYPLSIPDMRKLYTETAADQNRCQMLGIEPTFYAVSDKHLASFLRKTAECDVAIARRLRGISEILDDTAINRPLFGAPTDLDMDSDVYEDDA